VLFEQPQSALNQGRNRALMLMQVANWWAGAPAAELVRDFAWTAALGFLVPLAALALLESRSRMRFLAMHTHLSAPQKLLPRPWRKLAGVLRWRDPATAAAAAGAAPQAAAGAAPQAAAAGATA